MNNGEKSTCLSKIINVWQLANKFCTHFYRTFRSAIAMAYRWLDVNIGMKLYESVHSFLLMIEGDADWELVLRPF